MAHRLAYVIFIRLVGVILKLCRPFIATPDCISLSNSTNAIPDLPGTSRTSCASKRPSEATLAVSEWSSATRSTEDPNSAGPSVPVETLPAHSGIEVLEPSTLPLLCERSLEFGNAGASLFSRSLEWTLTVDGFVLHGCPPGGQGASEAAPT